MFEWIPIDEELPPIFVPGTDTDFLAGWFIDGDLCGIEWYTWLGVPGEYWNQNSFNVNRFGAEQGPRMFTHWMCVPTAVRKKEIDNGNS